MIACVGCQPAGSLGIPGIELTPPMTWHRIESTAGDGPRGLPGGLVGSGGLDAGHLPDVTRPGGFGVQQSPTVLANRLENLPGLRIRDRRTETVGGTTAAQVEVVAPGTGDALAPSGVGTPIAPAGEVAGPDPAGHDRIRPERCDALPELARPRIVL